MKLFLIATLISSSAAFAPAPPAGRQSVALQSSSANAIEAALAATKKYGPTSKEAAVLWDIVEEMDASDNRCVERSLHMKVSIRGFAICFSIISFAETHITCTHLSSATKTHSVAYKPAIVDAEYENKVKTLAQMLTKTREELDLVKQLAEDLKGVKLASPVAATSSDESEDFATAMTKALAAARTATEKFGVDSTQAKLAWETVEEIAASATDDEATRAPLDEECLIELIEGCEALEKFKAALDGR